jgi:hypothetical protein
MSAPDLVVTALAVASNRQLGRALVVLPRVVADRPHLVSAARAVLDDRLPDLVRRAAADDALLDGLAAAVELLRPQVGAVAAIDELPPITTRTARLVGEVLLTAGPIRRAGLRRGRTRTRAAAQRPQCRIRPLGRAGLGGEGRPTRRAAAPSARRAAP